MQIDLMEAKVSQMRTGEARAAVRDLIAKVRELEKDAARWRYLKPRYTGFDFDWMPSSEGAGDGKSVMCFDMGHDFRFSADCERDIDAARGGKE